MLGVKELVTVHADDMILEPKLKKDGANFRNLKIYSFCRTVLFSYPQCLSFTAITVLHLLFSKNSRKVFIKF